MYVVVFVSSIYAYHIYIGARACEGRFMQRALLIHSLIPHSVILYIHVRVNQLINASHACAAITD